MPPYTTVLAGIGPIQSLVTISQVSVAALVLLLPHAVKGAKHKQFTTVPADKFVFAFWVLIFILDLRDKGFTGSIRLLFDSFCLILLPYIVITRYAGSLKDHNKIIGALVLGLGAASIIAIFESVIYQYKIYNILNFKFAEISGVQAQGSYRMGFYRASATFASPISLGIYMALLFLMTLYLRPFLQNKSSSETVSYTHLTLPTILRVDIYVGASSVSKKTTRTQSINKTP